VDLHVAKKTCREPLIVIVEVKSQICQVKICWFGDEDKAREFMHGLMTRFCNNEFTKENIYDERDAMLDKLGIEYTKRAKWLMPTKTTTTTAATDEMADTDGMTATVAVTTTATAATVDEVPKTEVIMKKPAAKKGAAASSKSCTRQPAKATAEPAAEEAPEISAIRAAAEAGLEMDALSNVFSEK
jgi:hypothetical protein